jgi:hypothetical protein
MFQVQISARRSVALRTAIVAVALLATVANATVAASVQASEANVASNVGIAINWYDAWTSKELAREIEASALVAADPVLQSGGRLILEEFSQSGAAPAVLINQQVPSDLTGTARELYVVAARRTLTVLLNQALGLSPLPAGSPIAEALKAMPKHGTDLAGAIAVLTHELQSFGGGTLVAESDGVQQAGGVNFVTSLKRLGAARAAAALRPLMPGNAHGIAVELNGIGNPGNDTVSTPWVDLAVSTWELACRQTGAARCAVSPTY